MPGSRSGWRHPSFVLVALSFLVVLIPAGCGGEDSDTSLPPSQRRNLGEVTALSVRVDGQNGYVLYEDRAKDEYALAIRLEGGDWKVAGVGGTPLS